MKSLSVFTLLCLLTSLVSCFEIEIIEEPDTPEPPPFDETFNNFNGEGGFELGRALFYDKNLSADQSIACASCHKQEFGFSDNVAFSQGIRGSLTTRNSMPIQNLIIEPFFIIDSVTMQEDTIPPTPLFWDGREEDIFKMVLMPFINPEEHGLANLSALEEKVRSSSFYQEGFKSQGVEVISSEDIANALVSFIRNITTSDTRLDQFLATGTGLTDQELLGKDLFFEKYDCNACHQVQSTSGYLEAVNNGFSNIGLDSIPEDVGLQMTTGASTDAGKFKIPSLRNVAFTAPYMHDGRFQSLDTVIEHYSTGILHDPNLDTLLQDDQNNPMVLNITDEEREALVAFLGTLSDERIIAAPEFSDPFK